MKRVSVFTAGALLLVVCPALALAGSGVVALRTAEPSCRDDSGDVFVDCGNGTVTDNRTGLVWLKNAGCLGGGVDWQTATEVVAGLADLEGSDPDDCGLSDGSSPGEWRLPSKSEWEAMVADASAMSCSPTITDDQGTGCWSSGCNGQGLCAFSNVQSSVYWSTTTVSSTPDWAWVLNTMNGGVGVSGKSNLYRVWPVRGVSRAAHGLVALQTADPSCRDSSDNIYRDCGNGTVTDNRTGLVWLRNADCLDGAVDWKTATEAVAGLADLPGADPDDCGLSDGSSSGEWRLPSKSEWEAMVADARALSCSPTITNDAGSGCWNLVCLFFDLCSFVDVQSSSYWTSTTFLPVPTVAWAASMSATSTALGVALKANSLRVWPVRGGQ